MNYCALKILFDNNFYNNLLNEIDLISKLNHLNIIEYLDYGKYKLNDMEYPYIVMKLCNYSLQDKLQNNNELFPLKDKLKLFKQICSGVEYLHLNNIIHRDLKLDNILIEITENGNEIIKIVDFGTARQVSISKTRTINIGTEPYMAPEMRYLNKNYEEQSKKEEQDFTIDKPLDIYSLGCILFKLFTKSNLQYNNYNYFYELLKNEKSETKLHNYLCNYLNYNLKYIIKTDLNNDKLQQLTEILQRLIISIIQRTPNKRPTITIIIDIIIILIKDYNNEHNEFKLTEEQSKTLLPLLDFQNLMNEKDQIIKELKEKDKIINEKELIYKKKENDKLLEKITELELQIKQLQ